MKRENKTAGMTIPQIGILTTLTIFTCAITLITGYLAISQINGNTLQLPIIQKNKIVGKWEKQVEPAPTTTANQIPTINITCASFYPKIIEFFSNNTYAGTAETLWADIFTWQGGEYQILETERIKMQTKNGFAVYNFKVKNNTLSFKDDTNCEFKYIKSKE